MSLHVQLATLAAMVLSGNVLGILFDSYRVVSRELRLHRRLIPLFDLAYWLAATVFVFRILYQTNLGEVRVFVFLGLLLGISAYFAFFSRWTIRFVRWLINLVRATVRLSIQGFRLLIIRPLVFLWRCLIVFLGFLGAFSVFFGKIVLQLLYPLWVVLKWAVRPLHRYFSFLQRWKQPLYRLLDRLIRLASFRKRR